MRPRSVAVCLVSAVRAVREELAAIHLQLELTHSLPSSSSQQQMLNSSDSMFIYEAEVPVKSPQNERLPN